MKQHRWHKEIKHWADGGEIEAQWQWAQKDSPAAEWHKKPNPDWEDAAYEYRIKSQPKEPKYVYAWIVKDTEECVWYFDKPENVLNDDYYQYIGKIKLEQDDD